MRSSHSRARGDAMASIPSRPPRRTTPAAPTDYPTSPLAEPALLGHRGRRPPDAGCGPVGVPAHLVEPRVDGAGAWASCGTARSAGTMLGGLGISDDDSDQLDCSSMRPGFQELSRLGSCPWPNVYTSIVVRCPPPPLREHGRWFGPGFARPKGPQRAPAACVVGKLAVVAALCCGVRTVANQ